MQHIKHNTQNINLMSHSSNNNKRIAKNTLLLYFRMLFLMTVSLYTSQVILNALGVEDLGIYNVVGGDEAMLSIKTDFIMCTPMVCCRLMA